METGWERDCNWQSNFVMNHEHWLRTKSSWCSQVSCISRCLKFWQNNARRSKATTFSIDKNRIAAPTWILPPRPTTHQSWNTSFWEVPSKWKNVLDLIGWLLSILTATGNGFVIFVVAKNRWLYSSANWFVLSLALADFGVGIAVFPSSYFCYYSMACNSRVYMAFFWFFLHSSVTNLCSLTWDRYIAIVHPLMYNTSMTERHPGMVTLTAWLISFAISLSLFVGMYATTSKTALKVLRLTGVSAFDIIFCALLFYAVVRILVDARVHNPTRRNCNRTVTFVQRHLLRRKPPEICAEVGNTTHVAF